MLYDEVNEKVAGGGDGEQDGVGDEEMDGLERDISDETDADMTDVCPFS